jgi:7,8-dihydropterin-6-yl-methyl-4-(beta-D-ribofuranosyl)aminobenzene 5'-phosphate synthase
VLATFLLLLAGFGLATPAAVSPDSTAVTILYDAFGGTHDLVQDWGFAALVEYRGKRILFDTGNNPGILAENARRLHVDLARIDLVVVSHRHGDHAAGLSAILAANPTVPIYAPQEGFGIFGASIPGTFYRTAPSLPDSLRYFAGVVPDRIHSGQAWPEAHFILVDTSMVVAPGIRLVALVSHTPGTRELHELSLLLTTPTGPLLIVGCSHPGIERILAALPPGERPVRLLLGGLHLVTTPDSVLNPLVHRLHREWQVAQVAPGHCTGEPAFAALRREYGDGYIYAGLGRRLVVS